MGNPRMYEAYGKAAAAAMAFSFGMEVDEMGLDSSGGDGGICFSRRLIPGEEPDVDCLRMAEIVILLATPFGRHRAFPNSPIDYLDRQALEAAVDSAGRLGRDRDETIAILKEAEKLASKNVKQFWGAIEAIAHALHEENNLSGEKLKDIYDFVKVHHSLSSLNLKRTAARVQDWSPDNKVDKKNIVDAFSLKFAGGAPTR